MSDLKMEKLRADAEFDALHDSPDSDYVTECCGVGWSEEWQTYHPERPNHECFPKCNACGKLCDLLTKEEYQDAS